jgi:HTH-type transcriptional regulator/antitoxin HigA
MTYNTKIYGKLLAEAVPGVISDDAEYKRIEGHFNRMIDKGEDHLSPEEFKLFELLAELLEDYESRKFQDISTISPDNALRFLMNENQLKQMDLVDIFGSQAVVSKVLNRKRSISKNHAKRLAERFNVRIDLFI